MSDLELFEQIESIRSEIIEKNLTIEQIDFGAGNPDEYRDVETMAKGVLKKTSTAEMCKIGLKGEWAQKLYYLVKEHKPKVILELGTCCGFSSIYMSKANKDGRIYTIEGSPKLAEIAEQNRAKARCDNVIQKIGRFSDILPDLLIELTSIDFAFIDGHHDKDATIGYFEQIAPFMESGGVMVFDDITWSKGMREAWERIKSSEKCKLLEESEKLGIIEII